MSKIEQPREDLSESRSRSASFEKDLVKLEFNEEDVANSMFDVLSKANYNAFTLIRGEIKGELNPTSVPPITRDQFNAYIRKQGGRKFLEQIFLRGKAALSGNFRRLKKDFETTKSAIIEYDFEKSTGLSDEDMLLTRKEKNLAQSGFADKIREAARKLKVDNFADMTFSKAFDSGMVYGDFFEPSAKGAAEYGLSWFEYRNRKGRQAKLKRAELARKQTEKLAKPPLAKKGHEVPETGASIPYPEEKLAMPKIPVVETGEKKEVPVVLREPLREREKIVEAPKTKSIDECKKEMREVIKPYLQTVIETDTEGTGLFLTLKESTDGKAISIVSTENGDHETTVVSIAITRTDKPNDYAFIVHGEINYDCMETAQAAEKRIDSYIRRVQRDKKLALEQERARETKEWDETVTPYVDGLVAEFEKSPVEVEGSPVFFRKIGDHEYRVILKGHESYVLKIDPEKRKVSIRGEVRIHPKESGTQVFADKLIVERTLGEDKEQIKTLITQIPRYRDEVKAELYERYYREQIETESGKHVSGDDDTRTL